ncbi:hypothetical protein CLAFUW4_08759 [Fulvia fulva]|uniref:Uncharacterized protein n=1 Tax=Passalora fulva TaxID=5499 RepID=A0A9Q8PGY6_PASFU|nr:uncharacterized protein CLAFUR5_08859 [Fulvia fulva]KAK4614210.1 hypothetical protein CLAFUR4_08764 [Fulvia fulva]KAK4615165.1 hypothetical protein CLAFUR0_08759 [Fulvia fulva]UJO22235.1 hypothetical protein CLAFUR5_08859 [Fulvia fulva]WPV19778.1 hypothetical protein CLAFUW4_08759 [Fulvia fulva]WPV35574.1 hypothetical protein CLAFUW7_08759 [Fulvia fulva]
MRQLLEWNAVVNKICSNLRHFSGYSFCVSPLGGWPSTSPVGAANPGTLHVQNKILLPTLKPIGPATIFRRPSQEELFDTARALLRASNEATKVNAAVSNPDSAEGRLKAMFYTSGPDKGKKIPEAWAEEHRED